MLPTIVLPTAPPPAWWPRLWPRLHAGVPGRLRLVGEADAAARSMLEREGWTICSEGDRGLFDGMAMFGGDGAAYAGRLRDGGTFLLARIGMDSAEAWRAEQEAAFAATVHLLDPRPECGWLLAFGRKGARMETVRRRVLMVPHRRALEMLGGGETQLLETLTALRGEGVRADISLALRLPESGYDLLHLFSLFHDEKRERLARLRRPAVVSTIFWDYSEMRYAAAVARAVYGQSDAGAVERALEAWRAGRLAVEGLTPEMAAEPHALRESQRAALACGQVLLPNGQREAEMLRRSFGDITAPVCVVPNAVRPERFLSASPGPFVERFGLRDFVLCAARLEPNKNQAMLIWALRDSGVPLVLAGRETDPEYAALCRRWAGEEVRFVGELSPALLASAYGAARVHALPSWSETPGLVNLEAGLAGCALVVGNRGTEQEYLGEYAIAADPGDWRAIREAVLRAWDDTALERQEARRKHILDHYTWERTAKVTAAAYDTALQAPVRGFLAPDWDRPETWQAVVTVYARAGRAVEGGLLSLYAGVLTRSDAQQAFERVGGLLEGMGLDADRCPEMEIVDSLPVDDRTAILLSGGRLDEHLRNTYGARCREAGAWLAAA